MQLNSRQQTKQVQTIRQMLSPKTIQMMKTFQQSYSELCNEIDSVSEENVLLEVEKKDYTNITGYQMGDDVSDYAKTTEDYQDLTYHLINQIESLYRSKTEEKILKKLITYLDERGYFQEFKLIQKEISQSFQVSERKVIEMLKLIQTLEPEGVGARSVKECLSIQLTHMNIQNNELNRLLSKVIKNHLDELADKKYHIIARKLEIQEEGVKAIGEYIKSNFTPNPCHLFLSSKTSEIIIPSFEVKFNSGKIEIINLESKKGPKVSLSQKYLRLLEDPKTDTKTKKYLNSKLKEAKELIERLEARYKSTEEVVKFLVYKQVLFFEKGPLFLNPLPQKVVATKLLKDPSTISRIVSSKYIYTPKGVIPLKQLCPRDHFGKTVKQLSLLIKQLSKENPTLSDSKLAELLKDSGIEMARRTVNKYRLLVDD